MKIHILLHLKGVLLLTPELESKMSSRASIRTDQACKHAQRKRERSSFLSVCIIYFTVRKIWKKDDDDDDVSIGQCVVWPFRRWIILLDTTCPYLPIFKWGNIWRTSSLWTFLLFPRALEIHFPSRLEEEIRTIFPIKSSCNSFISSSWWWSTLSYFIPSHLFVITIITIMQSENRQWMERWKFSWGSAMSLRSEIRSGPEILSSDFISSFWSLNVPLKHSPGAPIVSTGAGCGYSIWCYVIKGREREEGRKWSSWKWLQSCSGVTLEWISEWKEEESELFNFLSWFLQRFMKVMATVFYIKLALAINGMNGSFVLCKRKDSRTPISSIISPEPVFHRKRWSSSGARETMARMTMPDV